MRCHICDKPLSEQEIQYIPADKSFEPCSTCLEIAMDAAYCDGFVNPDDEEIELELGDEFGDGFVEILDDPDLFSSDWSSDDIGIDTSPYE